MNTVASTVCASRANVDLYDARYDHASVTVPGVKTGRFVWVNLTPHVITLRTNQGEIDFPVSGWVARVEVTQYPRNAIDGIEIHDQSFNLGAQLPAPCRHVNFLVSSMVLQRSTRFDLFAPDTTNAFRDIKGNILAVPGFVRFIP